jgi:hypothetical protein
MQFFFFTFSSTSSLLAPNILRYYQVFLFMQLMHNQIALKEC